MALKPLNDVALVEIEVNQYKLNGMKLAGGDSKQGVESGIVIELPETIPFVGFHSFAFDGSLFNKESAKAATELYSKLIGKRVYWKALSDRGSVLMSDDKSYGLIKFTDLIAWSEVDEIYKGEDKSKLL